MRYEVSVKATYVPKWGIKDAFREFGSNAFDAETEMESKATVRYRKENETLYIENEGVVVPREALLFGHTTKVDKAELIGQFGEGLKLACLAAVREGYKVRIRSGSEVWVPSMVDSKVFPGTQVLGFDIQTGRKEEPRVVVEVTGVSPEQWSEFRQMFLRLDEPKKDEVVKTWRGSLLRGERYVGKLFVKGVLVEHDQKLKYGYDLKDAKVDRDRRIIDTWDKEWAIKEIWNEASRELPEVKSQFVKALFNQDGDTAAITEHSAQYVDRELAKAAAEHFREEHDEDAVPVTSEQQAQDMAALGKKPVMVPRNVAAVLNVALGSPAEQKQKLLGEAVRTYRPSELLGPQTVTLMLACQTLQEFGVDIADDRIDVCDFRSADIRGQVQGDRLLVASRLLTDQFEVMQVIVHLLMGSNSEQVGQLWCKIARGLVEKMTARTEVA